MPMSRMVRKSTAGSASGSSTPAGSRTPISLACAIRPGIAAFPKPLRVRPKTSGSKVHSGTGCAWILVQVKGSVGSWRVKTLLESAGGRVACGEWAAEVPGFAERGDQRRVPVFLVEHRAWLNRR